MSTQQQAAASTALITLASYLIVTAPGVVAAHNADSLIPVFVSLESWSLFYWGQDRFGMLLPLLARPVHDSFQNLLLQNFLSIALWLVGLTAALARLGLRSSVWWTLAIATLFVVTGSHLIRLTLLTTNQSYAPAVGLFGLAMYACRPSALAYVATVLLSVLGGWTNAGVALLTAIVTLTLLPVRRTRAITVPMFAGASVSIVAHRVLQTWAPARTTLLRWSDAGEVPRIVWAFWADCYAMAGSVFWLVLTVLWLVALARVWRQSVGVPRDDYRCLLGIAVGTFVYGVVMAVAFEGLGRHFVAALPLVVSAPVVVLARAQSHAFSRTVMRATTVAIGATLTASTGVHSPAEVRRDLIQVLGRNEAQTLYSRGVTVITGDYFEVWRLVFAINALHEQHGGQRPVLPAAPRSEPLRRRLLMHLESQPLIAIVPPRYLDYWQSQPDLPQLREIYSSADYELALVTRNRSR